MPRDDELDRLKAEQDRAFQRKQDAWETQDRAWERRKAARAALDRAHQEKQDAYEAQQDAWEELQRVRDRNGPRIDRLNGEQEAAFQNMKDAFERASDAHDARDGASARAYADEGHRHKAEAQAAVAERRQLVQEIRDAKARHEAARAPFQRAKVTFDRAKDHHDGAKADHERARDEFRRAKADFQGVKDAFHDRLAVVRAARQQRRDDRRSIAERAGIPYQYLDNVYISTEPDGTVNIYFGGFGSPDGPGHGHYAMDPSGDVTYARDPSDEHGAQNFADHEERQERTKRSPKGPWTPASSQPPHVGIIAGTEGGLDNMVSFKVNQKEPPYDDVLIADGDYSDDNKGFSESHDHSWYDPETGERGYKDRGHYTGPGGSNG